MSLARARTRTIRFGDEHTNHEDTMPPQRQTAYSNKTLLVTETCTGIHTIQPVSGQRGDNQHGTEMTLCSQPHNMDAARSKPLLISRTITKLGTLNSTTVFEAGRVQQIRMLTQIRRKKWKWIGPTLGKQHANVTRQALFWNSQENKNMEGLKTTGGGLLNKNCSR